MLGTVEVLRRYPVKSMLGEELTSTSVTDRGLAHDRRLALIHTETGLVASAKHPRLWSRLLGLRAEVSDGAVRITLPDGKYFWDTDADRDSTLSDVVGHPVRLVDTPPARATLERAVPEEVLRDGITAEVNVTVSQLGGGSPPGTFFDFAPLHVLTTATLNRIGELHPAGEIAALRYRPNIVIDTPGLTGFAENDWVGQDLRVGADLVVKIMARSPRCAIPTLAHGDLARDTAAVRVLARHNRVIPVEPMGPEPCAGVYAQVVHPGEIRLGDPVRPV